MAGDGAGESGTVLQAQKGERGRAGVTDMGKKGRLRGAAGKGSAGVGGKLDVEGKKKS